MFQYWELDPEDRHYVSCIRHWAKYDIHEFRKMVDFVDSAQEYCTYERQDARMSPMIGPPFVFPLIKHIIILGDFPSVLNTSDARFADGCFKYPCVFLCGLCEFICYIGMPWFEFRLFNQGNEYSQHLTPFVSSARFCGLLASFYFSTICWSQWRWVKIKYERVYIRCEEDIWVFPQFAELDVLTRLLISRMAPENVWMIEFHSGKRKV